MPSQDYEKIEEPVIEYTDELAPGEQVIKEHAHTGFQVDWYRTVFYPEGAASSYAASVSGIRELIHSEYEARPEKILEGKVERE